MTAEFWGAVYRVINSISNPHESAKVARTLWEKYEAASKDVAALTQSNDFRRNQIVVCQQQIHNLRCENRHLRSCYDSFVTNALNGPALRVNAPIYFDLVAGKSCLAERRVGSKNRRTFTSAQHAHRRAVSDRRLSTAARSRAAQHARGIENAVFIEGRTFVKEKLDLATAIEKGIKLARGVSTGRPDGAYFTVLGPEGIHASVLGLAALGAGDRTAEGVIAMNDDQRDRYAREVLAQFPDVQRGDVIDWSSLGGASPWEVVARLRGKYGTGI